MAQENQENKSGKISRRDILAGLAALPLVGIVGYGLLRNKAEAEKRNSSLLSDIKPEIQNGIPPLIEGKNIADWNYRFRRTRRIFNESNGFCKSGSH